MALTDEQKTKLGRAAAKMARQGKHPPDSLFKRKPVPAKKK